MFGHYFTVAVRNLLKYKTQNLICILGLAVGILCFTFCLYCTRFVSSTNSCFENKERIMQLIMHDEDGETYSGTSAVVAEELRQMEIPPIEGITCIPFTRKLPYNVHLSEEVILPYTLTTIETDTAFYSVFTPKIIAGSWESATLQDNSIIISRSTADKIFGGIEEALGKTMVLAKRLYNPATPKTGGVMYCIEAVMEDIPINNTLNFMSHIDGLRLNDSEGFLQYRKRGKMTGTDTYILLKENASPKEFTEHLKSVGYSYRLYESNLHIVAEHPKTDESFRLMAVITFVIGVLILAIALLNFFNFLLSTFYTKTKEYTVRKVYGGSRKHLFMQLYVQAAIMVFSASLIMLSIIEILGNNLHFSSEWMELEISFSSQMLLEHALQYTAFLLVACAVICNFVALRLHRISAYKGIVTKTSNNGVVGRNIMLWVQLLISWIFIGGVFAMLMQSHTSTNTLFPTLSKKEKGEIISIPMDYSFMSNTAKQTLTERFGQHSGVVDIMCCDISLVDGYSGYTSLYWEGEKEKPMFEAGILSYPNNYLNFMNLQLLQGELPVTEKDILVDSRFSEARGIDVVGKKVFSYDGEDYNICGICDSHNFSIYTEIGNPGFIFIPRPENEYIGHCYVKCHSGQVSAVKEWIEGILKSELPPNIECKTTTFLDDIYQVQVFEYTLRKIFLFFAVVCIILTLLGVYSSISYDTTRRQKEVALRKINGAGKLNIAWVFIRLYAILLCSSAAVAFPLLYLVFGFWSQMYVNFFEYGFLFWSGLFVFLTSMVATTISWKINRIVRLNPAEVIKSE